jgi:hypothetical protein
MRRHSTSLWVLALFAGACGTVASSPGNDMAVSPPDFATAPAIDFAAGDLVTAPACLAGQGCTTGSGNGLCNGTACLPCTDVTDDGNCAAVYGAGNICVGGACIAGNCRMASDCAGKPCVANQCTMGCGDDTDCSGATPVCNTASGVCVAQSATGCGGDNSVCPVNGNDVCCSAACKPGGCCGTGACTIAGGGTGTCDGSGNCVAATCPAVTGNTLYVDYNAASGGNGASPGCALKTIVGAFAKVGATGNWKIIVRGGTGGSATNTTSVAHVVPSGVTIAGGTAGSGTGAASTFAECTDITACPSTAWPILVQSATPHNGFDFTNAGPGGLQYFVLVGPPLKGTPPAPNTTRAGVRAINTGNANPVKLNHVIISQFDSGVLVDNTGNMTMGEDVNSNKNNYGLYCATGSTTAIKLGAAATNATRFDGNVTDGIHVVGGATLFTLSGPPAAGGTSTMIGASSNGRDGIQFAAPAPGSTIDGVNVQQNGGTGIHLYGGAQVSIRNSHIYKNGGSAIYVQANGTNYDVSGIDLGTSATGANAGLNQIYKNGNAGICVQQVVAKNQKVHSLTARGNDFSDYTQASPPARNCSSPYPLAVGYDCMSGATDVADFFTSVLDVAACVAF